jgi:hypothetical protein
MIIDKRLQLIANYTPIRVLFTSPKCELCSCNHLWGSKLPEILCGQE